MKRLIWVLVLSSSAHALTAHVTASKDTGQKDARGWPILQTCYGTCVALDKKHLLTAAHNVEKEYPELNIVVGDQTIKCKVVKRDAENDLALLESSVKLDAEPVVLEKRILTMEGSPAATEIVSSRGEPSGQGRVACKTKIGISGGPVWNEKNELAGLVVSGTFTGDPKKWNGKDIQEYVFVTASTIRVFLNAK